MPFSSILRGTLFGRAAAALKPEPADWKMELVLKWLALTCVRLRMQKRCVQVSVMKGGCGEKQNFYIPAPRSGGSVSVQVAVMRLIIFPTALNIAPQIACKEWGFTRTN